MTDRGISPWLSLGEGGWTLHFASVRTSANSTTSLRLSHYANTWTEHLAEIAPDALGTDTRAIANDLDLISFAVSGPMGDPDVPAGMVRAFMGELVPWRDEQDGERDPRFGNAHSLDFVALDVYATILERFGGEVFNPHDRARELAAAKAAA